MLRAQVTSTVIMTDEGGKSKGFGFVNFDNPETAHRAVEALNGKDLEGKELFAGARPEKGRARGRAQAEVRKSCSPWLQFKAPSCWGGLLRAHHTRP